MVNLLSEFGRTYTFLVAEVSSMASFCITGCSGSVSDCLALGSVWVFFPMSVEALTAGSQGRRAAKAKELELVEDRPVRSLVAARIPAVHYALARPQPGRNIFRSRVCGCAIFCATYLSGA